MNKALFLCLWLLGFFPTILMGQNSPFFETIESQKVPQSELQADELDRTYIRFYDGLFKSTQPFASESIAFDLEGERREFTITNRAEYYAGVYSVIAKEHHTGSLFIATIQGSRFTAKVHDHLSESTRHIRYDESVQQHYVTTLNVAEMDILGCGLDDHSVEHYHSHSVRKQVASASMPKTGSSQQTSSQSTTRHVDAISTLSSLEDKTTIDILYVYTDAAQEFAETCKFNGYSVCESITTIEAYLAQATIMSQSAFDNSGIAIELRPVLNYKVDYDETSDEIGSGERLRRLTTSPTFNPSNWNSGGYMDDVHEIRDEVGADMVAGIFNLSDVGGIAWLLGSPVGYPELAFSLNRIQQILTGYTLAHELGHNMGNAHSRSQTSNAAGVYGGMFHYSVGYQWVTENEAFVSVMGYTEDKETLSGDTVRTQEAGLFSSPDVQWQGVAAGTLDPEYGPTNAAQNNKQIKLTIADYRPTTVDAPVLSVDQEAVTVSMNREEQLEVPLTLSNTGASNLMWRVATEPVGLSKTRTLTDILPQETILPKRVFTFVEKLSSNHVFNETFEAFESRLIGGYRARQGWRTESLDNLFAIKTNNPSSGQKHLQIQASEESSYWVRSPFFGPQLEGTFEVSFYLSITKDSNTDGFNAVDLKFYDGVNGTLAAGVAVNSDLQFQTFHRSEQGGGTTTKNTGEYFESNTSGNESYRTVRIKLNATTSRIEYYLDDVLVDESYYLSADVLDIFYITVYGNTHPLGLVDIDNVEVQRPYIVEWLDIDDVAGAIDPGSQGSLDLSFNTVGVDAGVYQTKLQLINNSQSSTVEIPITLSVSNQIESVGRVALSTPSDGSSGLALTPTLSWNDDAYADSYTIQVSTDGFESFVVNESLSETSYTTSDLEYNTEYSWRVRGSNSSEDGDWSEVWTFTTKAAPTIDPPGTPSLSTPANGADDVLRPIAFSWEGAARAETYTLEVSEDDFATVALRTTTSSTSYSTSSLAYKASYSWRVKATNEAGDGEWSEVYTFAMGTPPTPSAVSLSSPANNASGLSNTPTLQWDIEPYAYAYDVQVSTDEFESVEVNQTTEGTSLSPSVDYNQSYSWRVRATNETGVGEWSATRTFATEDAPAPGVTTLSFPSDASTNIAPDTSFVWQPTTYASSYVIEIRTDADVLTTDTVQTTSYAMSLDNATSYSWRVMAFNSKGSGAWSDTWSFTTVAKPIEAIQNLRPTNDAGNVSTSPTFVWQADSNAASYQLQLSEDGFESMYEQTSTTDTSATVGGLAHRSTYSWRVRGVNTGIKGAWSEPFTFTTQPPSVSVPVILTPEQNADSVAIPTEFTWHADENATSYQAELFTDAFTVKVFGQSLTDTSIVYTEMVTDKGYLFRVRAVNAAGTSNWRSVEFRTAEQDVNTSISSSAIPTEYSLGQNYPNPFNPATTIQYSLPVGSHVSLRVYNMLGQKVETLVDGVKSAGYHQVTFDASNLSSGSYIYRLETGEYAQMRTMFLVK